MVDQPSTKSNAGTGRRKLLKNVGKLGLAGGVIPSVTSATGGDSQQRIIICSEDDVGKQCGGGGGYPLEYSETDTFGQSSHKVHLGTGISKYAPVYRESTGQWEVDVSVSGEATCRDSGGNAVEKMWWQEIVAKNYSGDLYSRNDPEWMAGPSTRDPDYDYVGSDLIGDAVALGATAVNAAAGTAISAALFLQQLVNQVTNQNDGSQIYRKWDVASEVGTSDFSEMSTFLLLRSELPPDSSDSYTVENVAIAFPEYPAITEYDVFVSTGPAPNRLTASERERRNIQEVVIESNDGRERERAYVAQSADFVTVEPVAKPSVPERVRREMASR